MASVGFREWIAVGHALAAGALGRYERNHQHTARFEHDLAQMIGARHVLTVTSGTSALVAAMAAAGIGPGDEVLVPAYTWIATAAAPLMVGAVPILVDIDESLTFDIGDLERKITPQTRALIPVHMVNAPADMDAVLALARRHGLIVIEDACQAVGVRYKDRYCGAIGDAGAFSFNSYKNINIGEGGAVATNSDRIFARARNYHDGGAAWRDHHDGFDEPSFVGMNMRATEVQGAMLRVQLSKLRPMLERLQAWRAAMAEALGASGAWRISPHHSVGNAVSLTVIFDRASDAQSFATRRGVVRLLDNSKHVYTNWDSILNQRTWNPKLNPWAWAARRIEYAPDMCARTLHILERTCRITLGQRYSPALARHLARRFLLSRSVA